MGDVASFHGGWNANQQRLRIHGDFHGKRASDIAVDLVGNRVAGNGRFEPNAVNRITGDVNASASANRPTPSADPRRAITTINAHWHAAYPPLPSRVQEKLRESDDFCAVAPDGQAVIDSVLGEALLM